MLWVSQIEIQLVEAGLELLTRPKILSAFLPPPARHASKGWHPALEFGFLTKKPGPSLRWGDGVEIAAVRHNVRRVGVINNSRVPLMREDFCAATYKRNKYQDEFAATIQVQLQLNQFSSDTYDASDALGK